MKQALTFILLLVYFTFSSGVTMHMHYCMGEFVNLSFTDTNRGECGKCGMEKHDTGNTCCKDVQITAKISDAHKTSNHDFKPLTCSIDLASPPSSTCIDEIIIKSYYSVSPKLNSRARDIQLYIQFRNLRI